MSTIRRRTTHLILVAAAAGAFLAGAAAPFTVSVAPASAQPCYNGVTPGQPFVPSCTIPGPQGSKIRGSGPDANAIIACRNFPGCLSWYVNGPY
jgi:hypothetical protein